MYCLIGILNCIRKIATLEIIFLLGELFPSRYTNWKTLEVHKKSALTVCCPAAILVKAPTRNESPKGPLDKLEY